jgi:hypothetical protein
VRAIASYSLAELFLTAGLFAILALLFTGADARNALLLSAAVAVVVQVLLFASLRFASGDNVMMAWGVGTISRFLVLLLYALLVVRDSGPAAVPALIGLATFFFGGTLLETFFLKR